MTDNNLLPCPFCGGEATVERIGKSGYYYIACNTAYCCDFGKFDTESEAIEAWNTCFTLGSGTLTAELVRGTVEKHWHDLPDEYDMPEATALPEYSYDWHAIADELNGLLGSGTCCITDNGPWGYPYVCSACGASFDTDVNNGEFNFCPNCGKRVVD